MDDVMLLAAHTDPMLDDAFPPGGPCLICGTPGLPKRHRMVDSIAAYLTAGETADTIMAELGTTARVVDVVRAWAEKWPEVAARDY